MKPKLFLIRNKIQFTILLSCFFLIALNQSCREKEETFEIPTIVFNNISEIKHNSIIASATVVENGGKRVTESGFIWSTNEIFSIDCAEGKIISSTNTNEITETINNLISGKKYYVKAYAINVEGIGYSEINSFTTVLVVIDIENNIYPVVEINGINWMAKNLKVLKYNDGSPITTGLNNDDWMYTSNGAYSVYPPESGIASESEMFEKYGPLYNWYAITDSRGLCPFGWRIPSDQDWKELEEFLGMNESLIHLDGWRGSDEGGKLKSVLTHPVPHPRWNSPNVAAVDLFDFNALPAGFRSHNGTYDMFGKFSLWWSSTSNAWVSAWYRSIPHYDGKIGRFYAWNNYGFAVRCIKTAE